MKENLVSEALKQTGSVYLLINVTARRAEQLLQGGNTVLQGKGVNPIGLALQEIADCKLRRDPETAAWKIEE